MSQQASGGVRQVQQQQLPPFFHVEEDADGIVWLLPDQNGLYGYDGANYVQYYPVSDHQESLSSYNINCICSDSSNRLWVGTQKGVDRMTEDKLGFRHYHVSGINNYVEGIFETPDGVILVRTASHLLRFVPEADAFEVCMPLSPYQRFHFRFTADNYGRMWIQSDDKVICLDASFREVRSLPVHNAEYLEYDGRQTIYATINGKLSLWDTETAEPVTIPEELEALDQYVIKEMHRNGDRMVFLTYRGMACYQTDSRRLSLSDKEDLPFRFSIDADAVVRFNADNRGNLWGIDQSGHFYKGTNTASNSLFSPLLRHIGRRKIVTSSFDRNHFELLLEDGTVLIYGIPEKRILYEWTIRKTVPLFYSWRNHSHQVTTLDGEMLAVSGFDSIEILSIPDGREAVSVECVLEENKEKPFLQRIVRASDGSFWSTGFDNTYWYAPGIENGRLRFHPAGRVDSGGNIHSTALLGLRNGQVAIAFSDEGLFFANPSDLTLEKVELPERYDQIYINNLQEDRSGNLWIGTTDWGLFRYSFKDREVVRIPEFNALRIWNICESDGKIYVLAESSVYRYNPATDNFSLLWSDVSGASDPVNFFPFPDGSLVMDNHGTLELLQTEVQDAPSLQAAPLHLILSTGDRILSMLTLQPDSPRLSSLRVKEIPENLGLSLSLIDWDSGPVLFKYRVNDGSAAESGTPGHPIPLYGLRYGTNRIWMQASSLQADVLSPEFLLRIVIPRPWYHWGGFALALLTLITLLFFWFQRNQKRKEAEDARQEKRLQEEVNQHNIDFFANISHEFRTPLTLIDGAAGTLPDAPAEAAHMKQVIRRNTDRMLKLVSQMLDFNKLDHDMLRLRVTMADAGAIVGRVAEQFRFGASQKDIDLHVELPKAPTLMWLDVDKLEKVMYNLLSNALKFTPPGGEISVTAGVTDRPRPALDGSGAPYFQVSVSDTGVGIPEDKLTFIFERFAQVEAVRKSGGTGIGLYYTKSLIELHHGRIEALNRTDLPEGKTGSSFRFTLPMSDTAYTEREMTREEDTIVSADDKRSQSEYLVREQQTTTTDGRPKVLVIDDDYEMVYFLKSMLVPYYQVVSRFDAMSGYQVIEKEQPDLVISDVMMVEVDGLQLCRMVKENLSICHIPVILLTAKSTVDDQIKGLHAGADAYIPKPFNKEYLLAMIQTQLQNRLRIRRMFNRGTESPKMDEGGLSRLDKELMDKVYALMESSLEDGVEFNVDDIAARISMSRTRFYAKIKALTGQTPNDFFNVYKLNKAAKMIEEGKYKISAIANMVGFSSSSHFATLFKKQFGVLPNQYHGRAAEDS